MFRFSGTVPANMTVDGRGRSMRWRLAHGAFVAPIVCPLLLEHDPAQVLVSEIQLAESAAGWEFDCWVGGALAQRIALEHRARPFGVSPRFNPTAEHWFDAQGIAVVTRATIAEVSVVQSPALPLARLLIA